MKKVHMIGNAHIDPVWLWRWQQGFAEIKATFQSALDRMDEFDDFIFTCAGACYYKWVEENVPQMFEKIRQRVREGRWVIVGGWWLQPDCNIPCGESFARHGLYSQRYYKEKFGVTAKTGYNVDSFGHNGMLPQLLKKCGMDNYVFMRPSDNEKELPGNLFIWKSLDGSEVIAFKIPISYDTRGFYNDPIIFEKIEAVKDIAEQQDNDMMCFYGVGNHGGGPTIRNILNIKKMQKKYSIQNIILSSPDIYFQKLQQKPDILKSLTVVKEDLQHHASGCYSAHAKIKKYNRKSEIQAISAEKLATISQIITGQDYPSTEISKSWEGIMFNQFHDILGGCSIQSAYDDAEYLYGESFSISSRVFNSAMQKISWSIDTQQGRNLPRIKDKCNKLWEYEDFGIPVVVFNTLSWEIVSAIELNYDIKSLQNDKGKDLVIQKVRAERTNNNDKYNTLFVDKIPAMGYKVYNIFQDRATDPNNIIEQEVFSGNNCSYTHTDDEIVLENKYICLTFNKETGAIFNLYDKLNDRQIFRSDSAVGLVIDEEHCDTWAHDVFSFRDVIGIFDKAKFTIIEEGPLRIIMRVESLYAKSILRQDFILYAHDANIEVRAQVDWRERHKMLKLSFPVNAKDCNAVYDISYGYIQKPANGEEEPGQQWVYVYGKDQNDIHGIAILNDCKYSFDVLENDLRMTVLRSPVYADHFGKRDDQMEYMDQGIHNFSYKIVPHNGTGHADIVKLANELNNKPFSLVETYHKGHLPLELRGIYISEINIIASVFKRAEDDDGYILRCYETNGVEIKATIDIQILDRKWITTFKPCEIKTFKIPDSASLSVEEIDIIELKPNSRHN